MSLAYSRFSDMPSSSARSLPRLRSSACSLRGNEEWAMMDTAIDKRTVERRVGRPQSCFTSCPLRTQPAVAKATRAHRAHSHGEPPLSCASMPMGSTRPTAAAQGTQVPPRPRRSRAASARTAPRPMTQRASPMCRASAMLIRSRCPVSR